MGKEALLARSASLVTWARFNAAFDDQLDALERDITDRSYVLPSYDDINQGHLRTQVARGLGGLRSVLAERRPLTREEVALYWSVTKGQAEFGVTLEDSITSWHIGLDVLCEWARYQVTHEHHPREVLVDFLDVSVAWWRQGSDAAIAYYRQHPTHHPANRQIEVDALVADIVSGRLAPPELADRMRALGDDPDALYHAVRARPAGIEGVERLRAWLGLDAEPDVGEGAVINGQFLAFVRELPSTEIDIAVGCTELVQAGELVGAFQIAGRAVNTAAALGLTGRYGLDSIGVQSAVLVDHTVGDALVARYVQPLVRFGASGEDVLATVYAYLEHHGNFDAAAGELFVHPNTVRYRVRRFEKETKASLRDTSTFVAVWWALERHRLHEARLAEGRSRGRAG